MGAILMSAMSCNSKSEERENEIVVTPAIVAIKNFSFKANSSVLANLDSVFFSIDLKTGVIFNANYLPVDTKVDKLVPAITFANSMTKAVFTFEKEGEIITSDYLTNPEDSIDFSQPVTLDVTAADGQSSFKYHIKVNIFKEDPDSIVWNRLQTSPLPSLYPGPVAQKTLYKDDTAFCLIEESTGEITLALSQNLNEGLWAKNELNLDFSPDVASFSSSETNFYLLDINGNLYESPDAENWISTGLNWTMILGGYGNSILGVRQEGMTYLHTRYPAPDEFEENPVSDLFPVNKPSALGLIESKWSDSPTAILAGGITLDGDISNAVWAFDGKNWAIVNNNTLPALEMPMLARYVVYRKTTAAFTLREFDVWLLFGGYNAEQEMNREVYMSYDNGVSWQLAPKPMQLSDKVPYLAGADLIVAGYPLSSDLADAWTIMTDTKTRTSYTIEGTEITWICPYLYIFGGYFPYPDNSLNTQIYRGVLDRLTQTPVI